jgi:CheY-like chemotaxis protein
MKSLEIVLFEDDDMDADLMSRAFAKNWPEANLKRVYDGSEGLEYLKHHHPPSLILLDISMPGMNGLEVLKALKSDKSLRKTPIIMCSGSRLSQDIENCYDNYANAYLAKPDTMEGYDTISLNMKKFWQESVLLPH